MTLPLIIHMAYLAQLRPTHQRFKRALQDPKTHQLKKLQTILSTNQHTDFGKKHHFANIHTPEAYQQRVPIHTYEQLAPWFDRIAQGQNNILTTEPILMMERTGGSTQANKLIPYTQSLLNEFSAATNAWIYDIYANRPLLWGTKSYWSVSPVVQGQAQTEGGIPIGMEDDTEYFGPLAQWALRQLMAVDNTIAKLPNMDEWRHATARALLQTPDLGFISIWHPSFWTILFDYINDHRDALRPHLPQTRQHLLNTDKRLNPQDIWPRLGLLSCWADASAQSALEPIRRDLPCIELQPKGLLATEGVVTIPWSQTHQHPLAITSHFFEFVDIQNPQAPPLFAWQLQPNRRYHVLLTTSGGLYRYTLNDQVLCTGFLGHTPSLRFLGKLDKTSDLRGEKLNASMVHDTLQSAKANLNLTWDFAMLAPTPCEPPHYTLFIETNASDQHLQQLTEHMENRLRESYHYNYCRDLQQLAPLKHQRITQGHPRYIDALTQRGQRAGDIKPTSLDRRLFWSDVFSAFDR